MFYLSAASDSMKDKNITFDFQVKGGTFKTIVGGSDATFLKANNLKSNNVTLKVSRQVLTQANITGVSQEITYGDTYIPKFSSSPQLDESDYTFNYQKKDGEDYIDIDYKPTDVGENTATVTGTGKGNYTGIVTKNFSIKLYPTPATPVLEYPDGTVFHADSENGSTIKVELDEDYRNTISDYVEYMYYQVNGDGR